MKTNKTEKISRPFQALIIILLITALTIVGILVHNRFKKKPEPEIKTTQAAKTVPYKLNKVTQVFGNYTFKINFEETDHDSMPVSINLISYNGEDEKVEVPEKIGELPVTFISNSCFAHKGMKSVVIPTSVKTIDNYAFYGCQELKKVEFKKSNGPMTLTIGECVFYECYELTEISFPHTTLDIGASAFRSCVKLSKITFDDNCHLTIGTGAFKRCAFKTIKLPKYTEEIGNYAFENCRSLKRPEIPKNCKVGKDIMRINYNDIAPVTKTKPTTKKTTASTKKTTEKTLKKKDKTSLTDKTTKKSSISTITSTDKITTTKPGTTQTTEKTTQEPTTRRRWFNWWPDKLF